MVGPTPPEKHSVSRKRRKALKCTVQMELRAITCPGLVLQSLEDIYLSVRIMGQYHKSKCVPPVFPLRMHERMEFVKIFAGAVDPGVIAEHLENDRTSLELIQLVPPEGEILATFEENTREFLYPGPRLTPGSPGPGREVLMKRSASFPGISPKVDFTTTSIIEEIKQHQPDTSVCGSSKPCHIRTSPAVERQRKQNTAPPCGYEKPTVASQSRAPSPYTHRRMCQLSEEARQRLCHLKLGPYSYKKETFPQAPFVVPRSPNASVMEPPTHPSSVLSLRSPSHRPSQSGTDPTDPSLSGSFISKPSQVTVQAASRTHVKSPKNIWSPASSRPRDQSPVLTRSSLRERFQSSVSPSQSQEIHRRVQRILNIHGPARRLTFDDESSEEGGRRRLSEPTNRESAPPQNRRFSGPSVDLDDGTFWSDRAAGFSGKLHRAAFEDSLSRSYKNLYRNATQS